jgi:SAM-dependent methyltransferase
MINQAKRLNIGCGPGSNLPQNWINLDGSWNAWLAKHSTLRRLLKFLHLLPSGKADIPWAADILLHDIRNPLPFEDSRISVIYASHLLEHLYLEEAKHFLKECYRVLEPGGILRMVVPDLEAIVLDYSQQKNDPDSLHSAQTVSPADEVNLRLLLRQPQPPSGNLFYRLYTALKDFHSHKWMYDAESLMRYFNWAGFVHVEQLPFQQSQIERIEEIEEARRVLNGAGICIEGIKPSRGK